jgi:hypothetical protein
MSSSTKVRALFFSLLPDAVDTELIQRNSAGFKPDDWRQLFSFACGAGLFPMFYTGISRLHLPGLAPEIASENKILFLSNLKKNSQAEKELLAVLSVLSAEGIRAIPLKGPVLARHIHGDLSYRQASCDIDILVLPAEKDRAVNALKAAGYFFNSKGSSPEFFYKFRNSIMLQKQFPEADPVNLDLHWGFRDKFIPNNLEEFWANVRQLPYLDTHVWLSSDEDLFIFLVLTAFSDFDFIQPKYLYDIHRLLVSSSHRLDWEKIRAQVERHGSGAAVFFSLLLSVAIFKTGIPEALLESFRPSVFKFRLCSFYVTRENIFFRKKKMMESYLWRYAVCSYLFCPGLIAAGRLMLRKTFISIDEVVAQDPGSGLSAPALYARRLFKPFGGKSVNS